MKMKKTIELFSGTKSFSKVANARDYFTFTIDNEIDLQPTLVCDLSNEIKVAGIREIVKSLNIDILWASPPCTAFSVASIGKNWDKETRKPKSDNAQLGLKLLRNTIYLISKTKPKYWFIENPRGMMRKVIDDIFKEYNIEDYKRVTISYCQYGDKNMKPTDIWTNFLDWETKPICKNGDPCHEAAPRGSRTGVQGLKNAKDRGVIPPLLFEELFKQL